MHSLVINYSTEAVLDASNKAAVEVNTQKVTFMYTSRHHIIGQIIGS
jgi:hypothetical protein